MLAVLAPQLPPDRLVWREVGGTGRCFKRGTIVRLTSRVHVDLTRTYPAIDAARSLRVQDVVPTAIVALGSDDSLPSRRCNTGRRRLPSRITPVMFSKWTVAT